MIFVSEVFCRVFPGQFCFMFCHHLWKQALQSRKNLQRKIGQCNLTLNLKNDTSIIIGYVNKRQYRDFILLDPKINNI